MITTITIIIKTPGCTPGDVCANVVARTMGGVTAPVCGSGSCRVEPNGGGINGGGRIRQKEAC